MYFIDEKGLLQLNGVGFIISIIIITLLVIAIVDFIKKFIKYRKGFYELQNEVEELMEEMEKSLPIRIEKYYQERKKFEKMKGYW